MQPTYWSNFLMIEQHTVKVRFRQMSPSQVWAFPSLKMLAKLYCLEKVGSSLFIQDIDRTALFTDILPEVLSLSRCPFLQGTLCSRSLDAHNWCPHEAATSLILRIYNSWTGSKKIVRTKFWKGSHLIHVSITQILTLQVVRKTAFSFHSSSLLLSYKNNSSFLLIIQ